MVAQMKMVGKSIIFGISLLCVYLNAHISLKILTDNGTHNQVVIGQPFTLNVSIDDISGSVPAPVINGLEKFNIIGTSSSTVLMNNKINGRFSYQVRIDTPGTYTIGPAHITYRNQDFVSDQVEITVVKDIKDSESQNKNNPQ